MVKNIAITGVESTGKSTLSQALAEHFKGGFVAEYARKYLEKIAQSYTAIDIDNIAIEQLRLMQTTDKTLNFFDTEMYVCKIWSEVKFNACSLTILNACVKQPVDAYIIPDIDLPWQADKFREAPNLKDRQQLMRNYIEHISHTNKPFIVVSGNDRLNQAIDFVKNLD